MTELIRSIERVKGEAKKLEKRAEISVCRAQISNESKKRGNLRYMSETYQHFEISSSFDCTRSSLEEVGFDKTLVVNYEEGVVDRTIWNAC